LSVDDFANGKEAIFLWQQGYRRPFHAKICNQLGAVSFLSNERFLDFHDQFFLISDTVTHRFCQF